MKYLIPALCLGFMLGIGSASAETAAPAPTKKEAPAKKERSAKSLACSKKADDQGLHGKQRHKFMGKCKRDQS